MDRTGEHLPSAAACVPASLHILSSLQAAATAVQVALTLPTLRRGMLRRVLHACGDSTRHACNTAMALVNGNPAQAVVHCLLRISYTLQCAAHVSAAHALHPLCQHSRLAMQQPHLNA